MALEPSRMIHLVAEDEVVVFEAGEAFTFRDHPPSADGDGGGPPATARCAPPCPARSPASLSSPATPSPRASPLLTLEAMRWNTPSLRPSTAWSTPSAPTLGAQVSEGTVLVRIDAAS